MAYGNSKCDIFGEVSMIRSNVKSRVELNKMITEKNTKVLSKQPKHKDRTKTFRLNWNQRMVEH